MTLEHERHSSSITLNNEQHSPLLESGLKSSFINDRRPSLDEEDSFTENGDDEEALLGGGDRERSFAQPKRWPQVKDIVLEAAPTLLFTTIGLLFTGELLDQVSHWRAMREVDQLIMIIPVILNLKGNLEMNLSARLGTAANVGELDLPDARRTIILGNLTLLQVQATVVSFVASCVSFLLGFIVPRAVVPSSQPLESAKTTRQLFPLLTRRPRPTLPPVDTSRKFGFHSFFMVVSTAMSAACLSSLILGSFMCLLIIICRRYGRDPDNIAPPIAACLGDLVTLLLIGLLSTIFIPFLNGLVPIFVVVALLISSSFYLLKQGWVPLFGAMLISSSTGIVLDLFVSRYEGFALLAIVISGLPGSVGSIFISRLSTALHAVALSAAPNGNFHPSKTSTDPSSNLVMMTLIAITIPVTLSLYVARLLTNFLWSKNLDPDTYALPIHSATMDLIGQLLLVLCFEIVSLLGAVPHTKNLASTGT
ncbi:hypothetical protein BT96DRAFT_955114 [Gymnopus androsaceus JB14]|uniref:SLC41A/MgtE integral membrane domain-containing protein n=1 Tax=Gymnopus androsaceus JB14 TaxID=1447944 RepID=A0A6A4I5Q2_9AGAR|nr:hypothetical protein BT96DRAFT_955114 [Gymnopus androsaceus JB14]